jgi:hypothetical protein
LLRAIIQFVELATEEIRSRGLGDEFGVGLAPYDGKACQFTHPEELNVVQLQDLLKQGYRVQRTLLRGSARSINF